MLRGANLLKSGFISRCSYRSNGFMSMRTYKRFYLGCHKTISNTNNITNTISTGDQGDEDLENEEFPNLFIDQADESKVSKILGARKQRTCLGCGINLQSNHPEKLGFIPESITSETLNCERCFKLKNYKSFTHKGKSKSAQKAEILDQVTKPKDVKVPEKVKNYCVMEKIDIDRLIDSISQRLSKYSQVFYLLDILDLKNSLNERLLQEIQARQCGVVFIVNKFDVLPTSTSYERIRIYVGEYLKELLKDYTFKYSYLVVSSLKGGKFDYVLYKLKHMRKYYLENRIYKGKCKVYVVGNCNVGKSTFINMMIRRTNREWANLLSKDKNRHRSDSGIGINKEDKNTQMLDPIEFSEYSRDTTENQVSQESKASEITTSALPGTTLGIIHIESIKYGCKFYDTPGLPNKTSVLNLFPYDIDQVQAIPIIRQIKPHIFNIKQGYSFFIGGLARVDILNGEDKYISCFFSDHVTIHRTPFAKADEFYSKHKGILLRPFVRDLQLEQRYEFSLECDAFRRLNFDIVINGLGWFSISGNGFVQVELFVPKNVEVSIREKVLLPYEIRENGVRKLFGKTINSESKRNKDFVQGFRDLRNKSNYH